MSAVEDAKRALQACEDGIALITAQQKANQALVDDYNMRHKAWEARRDAANQAWNIENSQRQDQQRAWDARFNDILRGKQGEIRNAGCGLAGSNPGCPGGWHDVGQDGCKTNCVSFGLFGTACTDGWNRRCQRNDDVSRNESTAQTINERGQRPGDYNNPQFAEGEPQPSQQNQTPINIACCANVANVV
jgi:hypothetical protein